MYKRWIVQTSLLTLLILLPLGGIALYNGFIDPLWFFQHSTKYNDIQDPFDERLLKTNKLAFGDNQYEDIVFGSSRVTYLNQYNFPRKTFNYAVSNFTYKELNSYLKYAEKANGKPFSTVYIGLDFWQTNKNINSRPTSPPSYYVEKVNDPFYRVSQLFSYKTLEYSKRNTHSSIEDQMLFRGFRAYNRNNVALAKQVSKEEKITFLDEYKESNEKQPYSYDKEYRDDIRQIKESHPHTEFVIFLTPVHHNRWIIEFREEEKWTNYKKWITETVMEYGEVTNFMLPHKITRDWGNFYDTQHPYPETGDIIINNITDKNPSFGLRITQENLDESLQQLDMIRSREFNRASTLVNSQ